MPTVRNKFHELGNWHNKISMAAIVTREALMNEDSSELDAKKLKEVVDKAINNLKKIEQFVIGADETIEAFKPYIYKTLDPDVEIQSEGEEG